MKHNLFIAILLFLIVVLAIDDYQERQDFRHLAELSHELATRAYTCLDQLHKR